MQPLEHLQRLETFVDRLSHLTTREAVYQATEDITALRTVLTPAKRITRADTFTEREKQVLSALVRGLPNKEIARELDISVATVKIHVKRILRVFGVANRTQAALMGGDYL